MAEISRFKTLVNEVKQTITEIDAATVQRYLSQEHPFYLIDVREPDEYQSAHLPGAVHISKGVLEVKIENTIANTSDEIVLYCGGGSRSALAAENLQRMGYTNVKSLQGGFRGWLSTGYAVEC